MYRCIDRERERERDRHRYIYAYIERAQNKSMSGTDTYIHTYIHGERKSERERASEREEHQLNVPELILFPIPCLCQFFCPQQHRLGLPALLGLGRRLHAQNVACMVRVVRACVCVCSVYVCACVRARTWPWRRAHKTDAARRRGGGRQHTIAAAADVSQLLQECGEFSSERVRSVLGRAAKHAKRSRHLKGRGRCHRARGQQPQYRRCHSPPTSSEHFPCLLRTGSQVAAELPPEFPKTFPAPKETCYPKFSFQSTWNRPVVKVCFPCGYKLKL